MPRKHTSGYSRSIVLAVLFLFLFCSAVAVAADCPSGCSCLLPADARAKGYDPCAGQLSVCGYDRYQNTMYCYKTGLSATLRTLQPLYVVTTTMQPGTCAAGCSCMLEADARAKFGAYSRCSDTPCYTVTTGSAQLNAYCFRQGATTTTPVPSCPGGCSCISEATAKAKGGSWSRCSADVCGYEQSTATLAAVVQVPKYCMKQDITTTAVCPQGCTCLSDANAKTRYGDYTRCSADVCGYETSAPTNALAATQVPEYCVKQAGTTPVCPSGCACISDEDAKLKGLTERCDTSQAPCGYRSLDASATTTATRLPLYCYKIPSTTTTPPVCPGGCYCLQEAEAMLKFGSGNYTRCSADICGYDPSATTANGIPRYCFRPAVKPIAPGCPAGCACTTNATAAEKGLTSCGGTSTSCGYNENKQPLYCYGGPVSTPICPAGCACTTNATAAEKRLTSCGGTLTSCGYNENKQPQYCFKEVSTTACSYDYQKNSCTGTCDQGYSCGLKASRKDTTGTIVYAVCGCMGQHATPCTYDAQRNACTGTCQTGAACSVVGKNVDEKTGATTLVCGCPQQTTCSYNYEKEACAGTCTITGENCLLNTIYRDPSTGKVTYAECQCKGGRDTGTACACDAATGSCIGNCGDGKACTMVEKTTDAAGKTVCSRCECRDTCVLNPDNTCSGICLLNQQPCERIVTKDDSGQEKVSCGCSGSLQVTPSVAVTRQPGFLEAIGNFFSKLFGGK